jgi:hypothetical protein
MSVTNQNQDQNDDGLIIKENQDGSLTLEWDPCDSRWSVLNGLTEQEIRDMLMQEVKRGLLND